MCAVGVEETAAIRAPLLDKLLRREWSLSDDLIGDNLCFLHRGPIRVGNDVAVGVLLVHFDCLRIDDLRPCRRV